MQIATFSGTFQTSTTGQPTRRVSYNGSLTRKNGKMSLGLETNVNGVKTRLTRNNLNPQTFARDPQVLKFLRNLNKSKKFIKR